MKKISILLFSILFIAVNMYGQELNSPQKKQIKGQITKIIKNINTEISIIKIAVIAKEGDNLIGVNENVQNVLISFLGKIDKKIRVNSYQGDYNKDNLSFTNDVLVVFIYFDFTNEKVTLKYFLGSNPGEDGGTIKMSGKIDKTDFLKNSTIRYKEISANTKENAKDTIEAKYKDVSYEIPLKDIFSINDSLYSYDDGKIQRKIENKINNLFSELEGLKDIKKLEKLNEINKIYQEYKRYWGENNKLEDKIDSVKKQLSKTYENINSNECEKLDSLIVKNFIEKYKDSTNFNATYQNIEDNYLIMNNNKITIDPIHEDNELFGKIFFISQNDGKAQKKERFFFDNNSGKLKDSVFIYYGSDEILRIICVLDTLKYSSQWKTYQTVKNNKCNQLSGLYEKITEMQISDNNYSVLKNYYDLKDSLEKLNSEQNCSLSKSDLENALDSIKGSIKDIDLSNGNVEEQILGYFFKNIDEKKCEGEIRLDSIIYNKDNNKKHSNPLNMTQLGFAVSDDASYYITGEYSFGNNEANVTYYLKQGDNILLKIDSVKIQDTDGSWNPEINIKEKEFILVENGNITLGSVYGFKDEAKRDQMISGQYEISNHEVTFGEFLKFLNATDTTGKYDGNPYIYFEKKEKKYKLKNTDVNKPVVMVTFDEARKYCWWLSKEDSVYTYSLPTEAEWEKAAKGDFKDESKKYAEWLENTKNRAYFIENSSFETHSKEKITYIKSGQEKYKIYDMFGNVWEWTQTRRKGYYVIKGGAFDSDYRQVMPYSRAYRKGDTRLPNLGFRVIRRKK